MEINEENERAQDHAHVADHVHHERLPRRDHSRVALVPEADQEIGAEAKQRPARDQEHEVAREDEEQHREDEDVHVTEEAGVARVVLVLHVTDGVADDQAADAGDDQAHEDRQVVDQQVERHLERAALDPGPVREVASRFPSEQGQHADEGSPHDTRTDEHGEDAGQAPAAPREEDRARGGEEEDQQSERLVAHPLSSLSSSTSSTSRVRKMSTRMANPTTASAAATVIDISANSWPSRFCSWRENVTSVRLAALSMSSIEMRITSGLRRTRTPTAPSTNRIALSSRNQEVSSCEPPISSVTDRRSACGSGRSRQSPRRGAGSTSAQRGRDTS